MMIDKTFSWALFKFPSLAKFLGRFVLSKKYPFPKKLVWHKLSWLPSQTEFGKAILFSDVTLFPNTSVIIQREVARLEAVPSAEMELSSYAARPLLDHGINFAVFEDKSNLRKINIQTGFSLLGNGDFNYYHWLIELLPKLFRFQFQQNIDDELVVIAPTQVLETPQLFEALEMVNFRKFKVRFIAPGESVQVEKLWWLPSENLSVFNKRAGLSYSVEDFLFSPAILSQFRDEIITKIKNTKTSTPKRIFLARPPHRRPYNEEEVFAVFQQYGFEKVRPDLLSFAEQVSLFQNSEAIAGPTGAAWTNLLFSERDTSCFYWRPDEYGEFEVFNNLAQLSGSTMNSFIFKTGTKGMSELYDLSFQVPVSEIQNAFAPGLSSL
jgi:capsular polysaccharide biosynthesis protein